MYKLPTKGKSIFSSRSFWGGAIALGISGLQLVTTPAYLDKIQSCLRTFDRNIWAENVGKFAPLVTILGGLITLHGVARRPDIFTPNGLPGKNRQDFHR
jgi:hypothetical protein